MTAFSPFVKNHWFHNLANLLLQKFFEVALKVKATFSKAATGTMMAKTLNATIIQCKKLKHLSEQQCLKSITYFAEFKAGYKFVRCTVGIGFHVHCITVFLPGDAAILPINHNLVLCYCVITNFEESKSWFDLVVTDNHSQDCTNNKHPMSQGATISVR